MEKRVTFYSDGLKLAGVLWAPEDLQPGERRAGIVLVVGLGGLKEYTVPDVARGLVKDGYVALTFDYRGFGESEGPNWRLIPAEQVRDIRSATTFLAVQEMVDPNRLGIYGASFGGGNAAMAAGTDSRLKCLVCVGGVSDGEAWLRGQRHYWQWRAFLKRLEEDRDKRVMTGESELVETYDVMVPDPATIEHHQEAYRIAPHRRYKLRLESGEAIIAHKPVSVAHLIAPRAALWIHVEGDCLVPLEQSIRIYEAAREPKRLVVLPGQSHYSVYEGQQRETVWKHTIEWFKTYVPAQPEEA